MSYPNYSIKHQQKEIHAFKTWVMASRPRTLPVSLPPIMIGTALASHQVEYLNWILVGCALLCSLGIQIGTNLVNDALDFKKGADGVGRWGPQRVTQGGFFSYKQVLAAGWTCFIFALMCGIPLMWAGGWPLVVVLFLSVGCGYFYTGGPWPLAYTGLSDFFVLLFFGWVSTCSVYYLLTGTVDGHCFLASTQIGLLAVVPHAINNLRDHISDARVHKRTFAVRFGPYLARGEITLLSILPFVLGLLWREEGFLWMFFLPFLSLPLVMRNLKQIWQTEPSPLYNEFLGKSALCELIFAGLLTVGILLI